MRKCLAPFFIGREEHGLENGIGIFDVVLPQTLVGGEPGSKSAIIRINGAIRDFVAETIATGKKPLVLCGDCLSAIGCLAGLQKCGLHPNLLWLDAHGDFHTPETTISGHLGGMPLAMITGRGDLSLLTAVGLTPLPDEKVIHVGARDLESGEKETFEKSGIRRANRLADILETLPRRSSFWVHFDTDYIDPSDAPAMRYPVPVGISAKAASTDFESLIDTMHIVGISISAWAPHLDLENGTATACWNTLSAMSAV